MDIYINDLLFLNNVNIIDIRDKNKYDFGHIPFSINISFDELILNYKNYLKKGETYYIYCQKGITSKTCVNILREKGYDVFSVIGGYEAYILNR